jgi:hypothetical protein
MLHNRVLPKNRDNAVTICEYLCSMKHELNLSDNYRQDVIMLLSRFSIFIYVARAAWKQQIQVLENLNLSIHSLS